jgi:hypothetical protein
MKKIPCILALALFIPSLQARRSEAAKSYPNAQTAAQNQTSPNPDAPQANEIVVQAPFSLRELRFDFGGLKLDRKKEKSANKNLRYEIEMSLPQLSGANSTQGEKFNQAVANLVAARANKFEREAAEERKDGDSPEQSFDLQVN